MTFYEYVTEFTRVYQENQGESAAMREARCVEVMSRYAFLPIKAGECVAGRKRVLPVGFSNEPLLGRSVGYFYDEPRAMEALAADGASEEQTAEVKRLLEYWKTQETRYQLRQSYPEDVRNAMPEDIYWEHSQVAFPLYRVVGAYMDYDKLLSLGLAGMKKMTEDYAERAAARGEGTELYEACGIALDALSRVCEAYGEQAAALGQEKLADALYKIAHK
ncbi:MAG: hypothetical protein K2G16_08880, partial [Lachnospiraceae bacterium]|nr:hypothetical protein [Lachnospiraceae bacterium]